MATAVMLTMHMCSVCEGGGEEIKEPCVYCLMSWACTCGFSMKPWTVYSAGLICYPDAGSH